MMFVSVLSFQHKRTTFNISCKANPVVMKSLSFYFSGEVFISPSFLRDSFVWYNVLGSFCFSALRIGYPISLCTVFVLKSTDSLMRFPLYVMSYFSLPSFKILSLPVTFDNFIMCSVVDLFEFTLFGIFWGSLIWMSIFLLRFENFLAIITK